MTSLAAALIPGGKRQARINELISTEEDYVRDLDIVRVIFRDQLFSTRAITASDKNTIFSNWDQLLAENQNFLKQLNEKRLEAAKSGTAIERIGSTIASSLESMERPYVYYCNRLLTAEKLIEKKSEDSGYFADQLKKFSRDPRCSGLNLAAYLLIPFQRVTRYPLLIKKIVESTSESHSDFEDVKNALNFAETLCARVNEGRRLYENRERLDWMQKHISLPEEIEVCFNSETRLAIHRELVHMGSLTKVNSGKELMAFLCNDFLLLTTPNRDVGKVSNLFASEKAMNTTYKLYKRPFFLDEIEIVTTSPSPAAEKSNSTQSRSNSSSPAFSDQEQSVFELWIGKKTPQTQSDQPLNPLQQSPAQGDSNQKLISFRAIHANDKLYWLQKLTKSIRFYHENKHRIVRYNINKTAPINTSHSFRLLINVKEVQKLTFRHTTARYYFVASVGMLSDQQSDHPQIESSAPNAATREPQRASLVAFDSLESAVVASAYVRFDHALRFHLTEQDVRSCSIVLSFYERTPFTPDSLLGCTNISLMQVKQTLTSTSSRPLVLTLPLAGHHRNSNSGRESAKSLSILFKVDLV